MVILELVLGWLSDDKPPFSVVMISRKTYRCSMKSIIVNINFYLMRLKNGSSAHVEIKEKFKLYSV